VKLRYCARMDHVSSVLSSAAAREGVVAAAAGVLVIAAGLVLKKLGQWNSSKHEGGPHPHKHLDFKTGPSARYFQAHSTGLWLYHRTWKADHSVPFKGHIFVVHGAGEHSSRYEHVAHVFNSKGYNVYSMDLEGHGQSEGTRCYFEKLEHPVDSIVQCILEVKKLGEVKEPVYLLGHSLGGLLALHVAEDTRVRNLFSGVILSGPALSFDKELDNPITRTLANTLSSLLPKMPVKGLKPEDLCTDPVVCASYTRDPLCYHGALKLRFGGEIMHGVDKAKAFAGRLTAPVLIVHGGDDAICKLQGSKDFLPLLVNCRDKELKDYPGLYHELLNESDHYSGILEYIASWMEKRREKKATK
jgi:acylglycerol lipase